MATQAGGVGVWDWDLETNRIYVDPILMRTLGYADHPGPTTMEGLRARVHPDDAPRVWADRELHDDLGQQAAGLAITISNIKRHLGRTCADPVLTCRACSTSFTCRAAPRQPCCSRASWAGGRRPTLGTAPGALRAS